MWYFDNSDIEKNVDNLHDFLKDKINESKSNIMFLDITKSNRILLYSCMYNGLHYIKYDSFIEDRKNLEIY